MQSLREVIDTVFRLAVSQQKDRVEAQKVIDSCDEHSRNKRKRSRPRPPAQPKLDALELQRQQTAVNTWFKELPRLGSRQLKVCCCCRCCYNHSSVDALSSLQNRASLLNCLCLAEGEDAPAGYDFHSVSTCLEGCSLCRSARTLLDWPRGVPLLASLGSQRKAAVEKLVQHYTVPVTPRQLATGMSSCNSLQDCCVSRGLTWPCCHSRCQSCCSC